MHSDTFEQLLDRAATLCGIGPGFWDIWGEYHETTSDAKRSILRAKGYDADDAASLERPLAARTRRACDPATCRVAITPDRAWTPEHLKTGGRAAGIAVSLYGVRSERNWGCGDFTDLLEIIEWVATDVHGGFIALNPLHAIHNRRPFNTSPYLPNCVYYQNFIYLDVEAIEDHSRSRRAQQFRNCEQTRAEIAAL